jgi:NAD(P)H-nitrite reductase large subunit
MSAGGEIVTRVEPRVMIEHGRVEGDMGVVALVVGGQRTAVDTVVIAAGRQPDAQLALMAGCAATFDPEHCTWAPVRDGLLQTTVPGMFVAGDAGAPCDVPVALAEGRVAGLAAAASLGYPADEALAKALALLQEARARDGTPAKRLPAATRGILCRCEGVSAETVRQAIASGTRTVNDVKRRTRAGMGLCQGAFCLPQIARLLQQDAGIEGELAPMTSRPPARPISLAALAGTEL